ncbi:hypothetical protein Tco_1047317 [Tanacetum coccineum]
MADSVKDMTTKFGKLDKFEGSDFRRWQKKMHFLLTTLKVAYVLSTPRPEFVEEETLEQTRKRCKWDNDDYICRGHILNGMSDALFDVYQNVESKKELWDQLEAKYIAEDTSSKKFLVSNFNNYIMVDSRMEESGKGKGKDIDGSSSVNMVKDDKNKKNNKNSKGKKGNSMVKKNNGASASGSGQGFKDPSPQQESRDAIFDENRFSSILRPKDIVSSSSGTQGRDLPGETPIEISEPQRSNKARVEKSYGSDF